MEYWPVFIITVSLQMLLVLRYHCLDAKIFTFCFGLWHCFSDAITAYDFGSGVTF